MEHMVSKCRIVPFKSPQTSDWPEPRGASDKVFVGILKAMEEQRLVPGQRLVETALSAQFRVGRNAVREAIQQLAARGIVELVRNRSPSIRALEPDEAQEVLEVAEVITGLLARAAARNFRRSKHSRMVKGVTDELSACEKVGNAEAFNLVRRKFYRVLLEIAANRELRRLFLTIRMEIVHAQFRSPKLQEMRITGYQLICAAVASGDAKAAEAAARKHVRWVRDVAQQA
jgi:DNA-binding GntR family transcriptional regulator